MVHIHFTLNDSMTMYIAFTHDICTIDASMQPKRTTATALFQWWFKYTTGYALIQPNDDAFAFYTQVEDENEALLLKLKMGVGQCEYR